MCNYNEEILSHYGIEKKAGSIQDGSIEDQIDSHLYRLLYLVLGKTKAPEKGKPYRAEKVGSGLYMFSGSGFNRSDLEVSYHVDVGWGGKSGVAHVSVEVPGRGKSQKKFSLKSSDRIDSFAEKLAKTLDALGGF